MSRLSHVEDVGGFVDSCTAERLRDVHRFTLGRTRPPRRSLGWEYLHQGARVDFELLRGIEPWLTPRHSTPFQHGRVRPALERETFCRALEPFQEVPLGGGSLRCGGQFQRLGVSSASNRGICVSLLLALRSVIFSKGIHVMAGDLSRGSRRKNCLTSLLEAAFEMYTEHLAGRAHTHIFLVHVSHFTHARTS